ncbi:GNAT family N-acetyltransferase [Ancylobacter oerskovii]|uniref:GNAT family N-acetyltransferase n=1 Tax=Ancylobacter oerskovii TaxID=459519 RepID=A0ABW4Z011_9HYPH|nr:GNAT family N-acetyltransferase [Ancylobacter oerskovii]MBS7543973.1 GNAT family N-acetyltransferase [Ancylobacter oerskovii]
MLVRDATSADEAAIIGLLRQIAAEADEPDYGPSCSDERLLQLIEQCRTMVIERDGTVIGLSAVRLLDFSQRPDAPYPREAFIMAFGIDEAHRRRGYGAALFEAMRRWLKEEDAGALSLNVSAANMAAQGFYRRMGLSPRSVHMAAVLAPRA